MHIPCGSGGGNWLEGRLTQVYAIERDNIAVVHLNASAFNFRRPLLLLRKKDA